MKTKLKKVAIILISVSLILSLFNIEIVSASDIKNLYGGDLSSQESTASSIRKIISSILNVIRMVGAAIAIVVLMILATKYIIASAGERADIKKYAINYVIGALILFGASGILTIIRNFIQETI